MTITELNELNDFAKEIYRNAVNHGWWEEERPWAEIVSLIHSELSEALEEYRAGRELMRIYYDDKPEGIPIELADAVIRILDYCGHEKVDIAEEIKSIRVGHTSMELPELIAGCHYYVSGAYRNKKSYMPIYFALCIDEIDFWFKEQGGELMAAVKLKHEYNKTRPYRHGGKRC
jgi:hypothetical protein